MKKAEAISILATSVRPREPKDRARYDEAVKMAIEALKCSEIPNSSDSISRRAAIDAVDTIGHIATMPDGDKCIRSSAVKYVLSMLSSVQPERDIPIKPIETTDTAWGISVKQAVCPKCDCYLGHVAFLGDGKGKKVTYCETCGQAIDWEGWDFDE